MRTKNYSCALEEFRKILGQDPDSAAAHVLTGEALDGLQKTNEAIAEFEAAANIAPRQPELHFGLGYLYWKSHQYDDAKHAFETELSIDPGNPQALAYLGDIAFKANNIEEAASLLEKSLQRTKDLRIAYLDLGAVRTQQKQYPAAVKALQRAIALDPTEPDAHYRLGRVYQLTGKKAEAEQEFAKTRELHQKADAAVVIKVPTAPQPP